MITVTSNTPSFSWTYVDAAGCPFTQWTGIVVDLIFTWGEAYRSSSRFVRVCVRVYVAILTPEAFGSQLMLPYVTKWSKGDHAWPYVTRWTLTLKWPWPWMTLTLKWTWPWPWNDLYLEMTFTLKRPWPWNNLYLEMTLTLKWHSPQVV